MKSCVVLFSGGIDSTTALYWALEAIRPGLPADVRLRPEAPGRGPDGQTGRPGSSASSHVVLKLDLGQVGGSALTDAAIPVPRHREPGGAQGRARRRPTFRSGTASSWRSPRPGPKRAASRTSSAASTSSIRRTTRTRGASSSGPWRRPSTPGRRPPSAAPPMRILAPFVGLRKSEIIRKGLALGADYSYSVSCYSGGEAPCGACSSCLLRERAWQEAGREDPLVARLRKGGKP